MSIHIAFIILSPILEVPCANIIKNLEDMMIREHKLRKRVIFSLDMVSLRKDFCLQCRN